MKVSNEQITEMGSNFANKNFDKYAYIIDNSERMTFRYNQNNQSDVYFDMTGLGLFVSIYNREIIIGYNNIMKVCVLSKNGDTIVMKNPQDIPEDTKFYVLFQFLVSFADIVDNKLYNDNMEIKVKFS